MEYYEEELEDVEVFEDEHGNLIDEDGNLVDENDVEIEEFDNFVEVFEDEDGNLIDEDGDLVDEDDVDFEDDENEFDNFRGRGKKRRQAKKAKRRGRRDARRSKRRAKGKGKLLGKLKNVAIKAIKMTPQYRIASTALKIGKKVFKGGKKFIKKRKDRRNGNKPPISRPKGRISMAEILRRRNSSRTTPALQKAMRNKRRATASKSAPLFARPTRRSSTRPKRRSSSIKRKFSSSPVPETIVEQDILGEDETGVLAEDGNSENQETATVNPQATETLTAKEKEAKEKKKKILIGSGIGLVVIIIAIIAFMKLK